jgi:hypothetical protein
MDEKQALCESSEGMLCSTANIYHTTESVCFSVHAFFSMEVGPVAMKHSSFT